MTFTAKYDGRCAECEDTIYAGDVLEWVRGQVVHVDCVPDDTKDKPTRPTCPDCWQEIPASGECGCG